MIHFFSEDITFSLPDEALAIQWLTEVARSEQTQIDELSYIFCSDEYLLAINQQYLNHDYYTDVITFDHREQPDDPIAGDIFISYDRVIDNSRQLNLSEKDEVNRVMLHGLLHLAGYGDSTPTELDTMRLLEDKYLNYFRETQLPR